MFLFKAFVSFCLSPALTKNVKKNPRFTICTETLQNRVVYLTSYTSEILKEYFGNNKKKKADEIRSTLKKHNTRRRDEYTTLLQSRNDTRSSKVVFSTLEISDIDSMQLLFRHLHPHPPPPPHWCVYLLCATAFIWTRHSVI